MSYLHAVSAIFSQNKAIKATAHKWKSKNTVSEQQSIVVPEGDQCNSKSLIGDNKNENVVHMGSQDSPDIAILPHPSNREVGKAFVPKEMEICVGLGPRWGSTERWEVSVCEDSTQTSRLLRFDHVMGSQTEK